MIWAAARSGRSLAPVNWHLGPHELAEVLRVSGAAMVIAGPAAQAALRAVSGLPPALGIDASAGLEDYRSVVSGVSSAPLAVERLGGRMMFSSGTTGTPKGILHPGGDLHPRDAAPHLGRYTELFALAGDTVYLSPAPTYHTAPFRFVFAVTQLGGTVVTMRRFDPAAALEAIDRYGVTHAQFVPTMLLRLLRLPGETKRRFATSSLRVAITGGAACPHEVKLRLMDWWGPVVHELYGASESYGNCHIGPDEVFSHPGSVGRALAGTIHITDADGGELPPREIGTVWFEGTAPFRYQGDESKTRSSEHPLGWRTVGDLGWLDDDGYLYLTGRRDDLIISGGVNIHPREAEDVLALHPSVEDVAVVGIPDEEFGQVVRAVVVPAGDAAPGADLAAALIAHCRARLAHYKCPRGVDFVHELPRGDNGKLYKRKLADHAAHPG